MSIREGDSTTIKGSPIPSVVCTEKVLAPMNDKTVIELGSEPEFRTSTGNREDADAANDIADEIRSDVAVRGSSPPPLSRSSIAKLNEFFADLNARRNRIELWRLGLPIKPDSRNHLYSSSFELEHHLTGLIVGDENTTGGESLIQQVHPLSVCEVKKISNTNMQRCQSFSAIPDPANANIDELASRTSPVNFTQGMKKSKPSAQALLEENIRPSAKSVTAAADSTTIQAKAMQDAAPYQSRLDPEARSFCIVGIKSSNEKYLRDSIWARE